MRTPSHSTKLQFQQEDGSTVQNTRPMENGQSDLSCVSDVSMTNCGGVTYGRAWGEDKIVEFGGGGPYRRVVQVEREVWSEVGVNRGEHVGLG